MLIIIGLICGLIFALLDSKFIQQTNKLIKYLLTIIVYELSGNAFVWLIMNYIVHAENIIFAKEHNNIYAIKYTAISFGIFLLIFLVHGLLTKTLAFKKNTSGKNKALYIIMNICSVLFYSIGIIITFASAYCIKMWGNISADQMIINMISPTTGTSDEITSSIFKGPVLKASLLIILFCVLLFTVVKLVYRNKKQNKETTLLSPLATRIIFLTIAVAICSFSIYNGVQKFSLDKAFLAFADQSPYIEENFADPNEVELKFPEQKRNLIHIYLESVENTYFSKELGGNMDDNLMPELAELTKEGYNFSHLPKGEGFGGHHMSKGATWSVASMVNMNTGLPMKVPVDGNAYGMEGSFLPGATTLGDILHEQGYNQSLMFGADAAFGGLNYFYTEHGDYKLLDYPGVIKEGWLDENYHVWWGYEDDKLYEFAKREITRLSQESKPFNFTMETADTHFPDGFLSPNCKETPYESQYANVIKFSQSETVKFVKWIQEQPFYENTTIVIIGDHLTMDENFIRNYVDPDYDRTAYSVIINPAESVRNIGEERLYNRQWAAFDMFPTILSSLGVEIPGHHLGLGTDLFSGEQTLFERDGIETVNNKLEYKSDFYNNCILKKCDE